MAETETLSFQNENEFVNHKFTPSGLFVKENDNFHTRLCVYNYFSEIFPNVKSGATVNLWFFDTFGKKLAYKKIHIDFQGQLQFDVSELGIIFEGTCGLSLIPDEIPELKPSSIGTGFYAYYYDNHNHADLSHEWGKMRFEPSKSEPWLCVVRPNLFPDTQIIIMNSYYGNNPEIGSSEYLIRLRNSKGEILQEKNMPLIPPCGSIRFKLEDIFHDVFEIARKESVVSVEVVGKNIKGPFTWVFSPFGDFNIHHFC